MLGGFVGALTVAHLPFSRFAVARTLLVVTLITIISSWWTFSPAVPWIQVPVGFVWGFGINGLFLLCNSFLADICDVEAVKTGVARQGFYSASHGFLTKCAISLSTVFSGLVISFAGVDGVESVEDPTRLRLSFIVVLGGSLLLSFWFYRMFEKSARQDIEQMMESKGAEADEMS
jgi:Na+/melibiose symporter-like transporter